MAHRSETILAKILTLCTGLTSTGTRVERSRVYEVEPEGAPALTINKGDDMRADEGQSNMAFIDRLLEVEIYAHVKTSTTLDTALSVVETDVYKAIMADRTLGLAFVHDTMFEGAGKPELGAMENGVAQQLYRFQIYYRHSLTSPEE